MCAKGSKVLLICLLLCSLLACGFPGMQPSGNTRAAPTQPVAAPSMPAGAPPAATVSSGSPAPTAAPGTNTAPDACLYGYWEVEPQSLADMGNTLITIPNLQILGVGGSIVFVFTLEDTDLPSPFKMETWYTDVLINAEYKSSPDSDWRPLDMHISGVVTGWLTSDAPGEIFIMKDEYNSSMEVTDLWIDGVQVGGGIDVSDMVMFAPGTSLYYNCLENNQLNLSLYNGSQPILLNRTSATTYVRPD